MPDRTVSAPAGERIPATSTSPWKPGFVPLLVAQFLGAYNDNLYKQLILLFCVDQLKKGQPDIYQTIAAAMFALPFVIFSGFAGYLSDRYSKRTVILYCKVAEVSIMLFGVAACAYLSIPMMLAALCLMGIHSAFFGPGKYGVLPEMLSSSALPSANGLVLMTTFLAIILGFASAGFAKQLLRDDLWIGSLLCVAVAAGGLIAAWRLPRLGAATPSLRFTSDSLFLDGETRLALRAQPQLLTVLLASSAFWLIGGMVYPSTINSVAKMQFELKDAAAGLLAASTGLGIAGGCLLAGLLSRDRVRPELVRQGSWGLVASLILLGMPGPEVGNTLLGVAGTAVGLVMVGLSAGLFSVPLQVYLQSETPPALKGRIIAALNLFNWIAILLSALTYFLADVICQSAGWNRNAGFAIAGLMFMPVALFYRMPPGVARNNAPTQLVPADESLA